MDESEQKIDQRVGVNFCVIKMVDDIPHVLLQQRDENSWEYKGYWCFPGGGAKEHEASLKQTATRELKDEYNLNVNESEWNFLTNRPENNPGKVFAAIIDDDSELIRGEGEDHKWLPTTELASMELGYKHDEFITPALQEFIQKHIEDREAHNEIKPFKIT